MSHTQPDRRSSSPEPVGPGKDRQPKLGPGSVIPGTHLQIVRWLGQGGMGVVFEVQHLDIKRRSAAKLLHFSENPARMRHFRQEARTISEIGSPWIVEIFDFQELPDGRLMSVMELVEGPSLYAAQAALAAQAGGSDPGPCDPARLIGLARQVCKGLQAAHEVGFIHRDIKPENIMLCTDKLGREQVKIVDFGLAALVEGPNESNGAGTPAYMSPEQCKGQRADARTDIYSLGVTLYELACGRLPFLQSDTARMRDDHLFEAAAPPSQLVEGFLPSGFDGLILRCMAKRPCDRFESAALLEASLIELQLSLGLRTAWDDLPAPQLPGDTTARLERGLAQLRSDGRRSRQRRMLVGAVVIGLLAIGGTAGGLVARQLNADARVQMLTEGERELAALSERARLAAAHARWIYSAVNDPQADTAYRVLLELERLDIPSARGLGAELRHEFSSTLVGLGDTYWARVGGRSFAREFYAQALVFEPNHARADERAGLSLVMLDTLSSKAAAGEFTSHELVAVAPLTSLANPDPQAQFDGLMALATSAQLATRAAAEVDLMIENWSDDSHAEGEAGGVATGQGDVGVTPGPVRSDLRAVQGRGQSQGEGRDHEQVGELNSTLGLAGAAYTSGQPQQAELLFHQALELDARSVRALVGLHRICYDRGDYPAARRYAERAARLEPKRGGLHVLVGDACVKVLDYSCARAHYKKAKQLHHPDGAQRMAMLDQRVGKPGQ